MRGEFANSSLRGQHGTYLRVQIAKEVLRISDIRRHHVEQVVTWDVAIVDSQGRNTQTLVENLGC